MANKQLSDSTDAALQMQGIGWLVRQAVKYSNVTLHVKQVQYTSNPLGHGTVLMKPQFVGEDNLMHIDSEQITTGNIRNLEDRIIDFQWREKDDRIFGKVNGRSRYVQLDEVEDEYLRQGWDDQFLVQEGHQVLQIFVESLGKKPNWTAEQVWGFEVVDGSKRHTRRIIVKKGKEEHKLRLVYDWVVEKDEDADLAY
ncbi:hypothetical protein D6C90_01134 [Aureobasidium pullulans]|uniref:Uncharacterized protein n=1 Tax=Aureobasidium pullulans TaxID=5580 RepID=A0A4S9VLY4_AURPU|nr:hypothetical protein D6C90_01134 [Aureobasidium pullulans]